MRTLFEIQKAQMEMREDIKAFFENLSEKNKN